LVIFSVAFTLLFGGGIAAAQEAPPTEGGLSLDVNVIAKQLDIARYQIQPSLGATVYDFGQQAIETQPQGDNQPLNQLLLQAPRCCSELVRPAARAQRPRQSAVPYQRSGAAGRDQCLRAVITNAARQFCSADYRQPPGAIRPADCRGDRYHYQ